MGEERKRRSGRRGRGRTLLAEAGSSCKSSKSGSRETVPARSTANGWRVTRARAEQRRGGVKGPRQTSSSTLLRVLLSEKEATTNRTTPPQAAGSHIQTHDGMSLGLGPTRQADRTPQTALRRLHRVAAWGPRLTLLRAAAVPAHGRGRQRVVPSLPTQRQGGEGRRGGSRRSRGRRTQRQPRIGRNPPRKNRI